MPGGGDVTGQLSSLSSTAQGTQAKQESSGKQRRLPWEKQVLIKPWQKGKKPWAGVWKIKICKEKTSSERPWKKIKIDSVLGRERQFCLPLQRTEQLQVTETTVYATGSRGKGASERKRKQGKINQKAKKHLKEPWSSLSGGSSCRAREEKRIRACQGQHMGENKRSLKATLAMLKEM